MFQRGLGALTLGLLVVGIVPAPRTTAEDERPAAKADKLPADLDFVFQSGSSFATLRPGDLFDSEPLKSLPPRLEKEVKRMTGDAKRFLGISVADIERVTFLMPSSMESEPVVLVRTHKPYDRDTIVKTMIGEDSRPEKYKGFVLYGEKGRRGQSLCVLDGQTFAVGRGRGMKEVIDQADGRSTPRPHRLAVEWAAEKHHVVLGGSPAMLIGTLMWSRPNTSAPAQTAPDRNEKKGEEIKPRLEKEPQQPELKPLPPPKGKPPGLRAPQRRTPLPGTQISALLDVEEEPILDELLERMPMEALPYKRLLSAKSFAAALDLGAESKARWVLAFADEDAAKDGEVSARIALYVLREVLGRLPREVRVSQEGAAKLVAMIGGVQAALRSAPLQRRGTTVEGSLVLKTDAATLKPFFAEMEKAAGQTEGLNNLKQIGLAMHYYHDTFGALPNAAICDKTGKPLLSWRVAILPFIEQENLYRQFKLDEPWDSPTNIKLLESMPKVYALPGRTAKKSETFLQVFTGPNTPFDVSKAGPGPNTRGLQLTRFLDGTSNTLLAVEAAESVPWTKPDDLPIDPKKPLPKLGGTVPEMFFALFADGAVRLIPTKIKEQTLRNLIDPADGNVIDFDEIEPRRGGPGRKPVESGSGESSKPPRPPEKEPERRP